MQLLPQALGSKTAATLLSSAYASSTPGNNQRLWEKFQTYCIHVGLQGVPASLYTVAAYLGYIFERVSVRGGSIRPHLAAIVAKHRMHGHTDPIADGQVVEVLALVTLVALMAVLNVRLLSLHLSHHMLLRRR